MAGWAQGEGDGATGKGERLCLWQGGTEGEVARAGGSKGKPWSDWMGRAQHRARGGNAGHVQWTAKGMQSTTHGCLQMRIIRVLWRALRASPSLPWPYPTTSYPTPCVPAPQPPPFHPCSFFPHPPQPPCFPAALPIPTGLPGPILPGILMASLFPAIIGTVFPGAIYASQTLKFREPALVGGSKVCHRHLSSQGRGLGGCCC